MQRRADEMRRQNEQAQRQADDFRRQADDAKRHGEELQRQTQQLRSQLDQANANLRRAKEEAEHRMQQMQAEANQQRSRGEASAGDRERMAQELAKMRERVQKFEAEAKAQQMVHEKLEKALTVKDAMLVRPGPAAQPAPANPAPHGQVNNGSTIQIHGGTVHIHMGGMPGSAPKLELLDGAKMIVEEPRKDEAKRAVPEEKRRITGLALPVGPGAQKLPAVPQILEIREGEGGAKTFSFDTTGKGVVVRKVETKRKDTKGDEDDDDDEDEEDEHETAKPAPKALVKPSAPAAKKPDAKKIRLF